MKNKVGCKACNWTGWINIQREVGQPVVRPCICRYEIAKKNTMIGKPQTLKEIRSRKEAEQIVKAYERHREKEEKNE